MKSGHGRLILRDGTDVSLEYRLATAEGGTQRQGTLIGDLSTIDPGEFTYKVRYVPADGEAFALLVTTFTDRHLAFICEGVLLASPPDDSPD